ncbi:MAG TPA: hypothetical protein DCX54_12810 [Flavobacteriales bacterium]|nr:hypothetical protein [Flavobacteriales bacterium]
MMKNLIKYLIQGLFYTVPIGITVYLVVVSIQYLDNLLLQLIPIHIPGLGLLVFLLVLVFVGYMGSVVLATSIGTLLRQFEKVLLKVPVVKMIYTALKDLFSALMGTNRTFDHAVIVTLDKVNDIEKIGFVTKSDLTALGVGKEKVAVYFPFSYGIMGDLRIVPKSSVRVLPGKSSEIMKFIVSGGVVHLEDNKE